MDEGRVWVLLAKQKAGEATDKELAELDELLRTDEGNASNEVLEKLWEAPLQFLPEMKPGKALWDHIEQKINEPENKVIFFNKKIVRWFAAAVVAAIAAGLFFITNKDGSNQKQLIQTVSTKPLLRKHLILPDGTKVWMNGNSELTYDEATFGDKFREVRLKGEAFFDVTKDATHLFIIHAANVNITVKGTAFNVKAYPDQRHVETSLIRGLVEVTTLQDPDRKILLKPDEKMVVIPFETRNISKLQKKDISAPLFTITRLQKDEQNVLPETVWMSKSLAFDNESLEQLAPKLESWFSIIIHIEDNSLKPKRFSGIIAGETLRQTLEALKLSYSFSYTIKDGEVWITK